MNKLRFLYLLTIFLSYSSVAQESPEGRIPLRFMTQIPDNRVPGMPDGNLNQDLSLEEWIEHGKRIYTTPAACITCHLDDATGDKAVNAKSLHFGPSPYDIYNAVNGVPAMGFLVDSINITKGDILGLSLYIRDLTGHENKKEDIAGLKQTLAGLVTVDRAKDFISTERDELIRQIAPFETIQKDWQRRSKPGRIKSNFDTIVVQTFDPGQPKFTPRAGKTYFYENVGDSGTIFGQSTSRQAFGSRVIVGDAESHEVITHYEIDPALRGAVHTTVMTPDGKYGYIVGAPPYRDGTTLFRGGGLDSPATLIKWDALTLQPVKQLIIGGRIHHGQIFKDKYILIDTFQRNEDGLDVFLLDPETDTIIGGVRDEDLGGSSYTAFTDGSDIFILMEPTGWGPISQSGFTAANLLTQGKMTALPSFWIARIDPDTWEVVQEYPYPSYRADWICFDDDKSHMYVPAAASSNVTKIRVEDGEIIWTVPTGIGPYGCNVNTDGSEVWVTNKGEAAGFYGRTVTAIDTQAGRLIETIFGGYMIDHVLLAPNGKEFWGTSNAEGKIYVWDAEKKTTITTIEMPGGGDAHGLPWVYYKDKDTAIVARDQGGFHNGINPRQGKGIDY